MEGDDDDDDDDMGWLLNDIKGMVILFEEKKEPKEEKSAFGHFIFCDWAEREQVKQKQP